MAGRGPWLRASRPVQPRLTPLRRASYGYQTWIVPGERRVFALLGLRGQAIYVDPAAKLVLVHTAVRKLPVDPGVVELDALWAGIREQLGGAP